VLKEIARNKRRSVVVVVAFILVWIGIGALAGWAYSAVAQNRQNCQTEFDNSGRPFESCTTASSSTSAGEAIAVGVGIAAVFAIGAALWAVTSGSRLVLSAAGAHPADPNQYQQLHNVVEAMSIASGLPKPAVYVIDDPSPNAFATGISPNRAASSSSSAR
jgi:heat shock protein HtpX